MVRLRVGEALVESVEEFEGNPVPLAMMFPPAGPDDLTRLSTWFTHPGLAATPEESVVELSWRTWVIRAGGVTVLVDTGLGNAKTRAHPVDFCDRLDTAYLDRLATAGVTPETVDYVVCTHLHFDHIGWNTTLRDGMWVPTFSRARYLMPAKDLDYLASPDADEINRPAYDDSIVPLLEVGQVDPISGDTVLELPGARLSFQDAPGHSAGSLMVRLESHGERAAFVGDLMHHPIQLVRPELSLAVEEDPLVSARTRSLFLADVAGTDEIVLPAHFPGSGAGRVLTAATGAGYAWAPVA